MGDTLCPLSGPILQELAPLMDPMAVFVLNFEEYLYAPREVYRGTSLMRNSPPPLGPL